MHETKYTYIKKQRQDKLFIGLYNISYINKTLTMFMYIRLISIELFPFIKITMQFDRTTFEGVISLDENRPTL